MNTYEIYNVFICNNGSRPVQMKAKIHPFSRIQRSERVFRFTFNFRSSELEHDCSSSVVIEANKSRYRFRSQTKHYEGTSSIVLSQLIHCTVLYDEFPQRWPKVFAARSREKLGMNSDKLLVMYVSKNSSSISWIDRLAKRFCGVSHLVNFQCAFRTFIKRT